MIFDCSIPFDKLPPSDASLKQLLNYNPPLKQYTAKQNFPGRDPSETDRGGWRGYDRVYTKYLSHKQHQRLNILEIGFLRGYGVLAWQRYFKQSRIYSVDIQMPRHLLAEYLSQCAMYNVCKSHLHEFDSTDPAGWLAVRKDWFDVIIDDGHHHPDNQIQTLDCAWNHLKSGGLYFIEDISRRYGDDHFERLADKLQDTHNAGHTVSIYSHYNTGLRHLLDRGLIKTEPNKYVDATEYIAVIEKA